MERFAKMKGGAILPTKYFILKFQEKLISDMIAELQEHPSLQGSRNLVLPDMSRGASNNGGAPCCEITLDGMDGAEANADGGPEYPSLTDDGGSEKRRLMDSYLKCQLNSVSKNNIESKNDSETCCMTQLAGESGENDSRTCCGKFGGKSGNTDSEKDSVAKSGQGSVENKSEKCCMTEVGDIPSKNNSGGCCMTKSGEESRGCCKNDSGGCCITKFAEQTRKSDAIRSCMAKAGEESRKNDPEKCCVTKFMEQSPEGNFADCCITKFSQQKSSKIDNSTTNNSRATTNDSPIELLSYRVNCCKDTESNSTLKSIMKKNTSAINRKPTCLQSTGKKSKGILKNGKKKKQGSSQQRCALKGKGENKTDDGGYTVVNINLMVPNSMTSSR